MDKAAEKKALDKAKRLAAKFTKIKGGLAELEHWLCDLIRDGLVALPDRPRKYWEDAAVRMIDAQAPGMAASIRTLRDLDYRNNTLWQEQALATVARMWAVVKGFDRREQLPESLQNDLKAQLGIGPGPKEVLGNPAAETISDHWLAIGRQTEQIDDITTQRNWLYGCQSGRFALVLYFAYKKTPIESTLVPGKVHEATLVFFPSGTPFRAAIKDQGPTTQALPELAPAVADWSTAEIAIANRLIQNPWLEQYPVFIDAISLFSNGNSWGICDNKNRALPFESEQQLSAIQQLMALSGGRSIPAFFLYQHERLQLLAIPYNNSIFLTTK